MQPMEQNKPNVKLLSMLGQAGSMLGIALMEIAEQRDDVVVLAADMSTPAGLDKFKAAYPDRFINVGIAEQNMIGIAAGLADEGFLPICVAQACFITMRCFEQVRQFAGYMGGKMILVGFGAGLSLQYMGNTHYAIEDIALMRAVPGMTVMAPCDAYEAMMCLSEAVTDTTRNNRAYYIRVNAGLGTPIVYDDKPHFSIGNAVELKHGHALQLIATGAMVNVALKVAAEYEKLRIVASVVNVPTLKPIHNLFQVVNSKAALIVTIEEHSVIGGLGTAVAEYITSLEQKPKLIKIGIEDRFLPVGDYDFLLDQAGLTVNKIIKRIDESKIDISESKWTF